MSDPRLQMTPRDDQRNRKHVLTSNGMGYFWCSCSNTAHVLWSLNDHLVEIAAQAEQRGAAAAGEQIAQEIEALVAAAGPTLPETSAGAWDVAVRIARASRPQPTGTQAGTRPTDDMAAQTAREE